jgi:4-carboxymuconolactone decarboxylase
MSAPESLHRPPPATAAARAESDADRAAESGADDAAVRSNGHARDAVVQSPAEEVGTLDDATRALVRAAAIVATGDDRAVRAVLVDAARRVDPVWVEEMILQTYLFAGFPRALNAMREWRRVSGRRAPESDPGEDVAQVREWVRRGEDTCAAVYGPFYDKLRVNIRQLHPALDAWMIADGYGKVLGRGALDLARRELCVIAACVAAKQDRQLHSHLHGALHVGASPDAVSEALDGLEGVVDQQSLHSARLLWARVRGK